MNAAEGNLDAVVTNAVSITVAAYQPTMAREKQSITNTTYMNPGQV